MRNPLKSSKPDRSLLLVARTLGEIKELRTRIYLAPDVDVHEVLVKDLAAIKSRKYIGGIVGGVSVEDRALCKAIIAASAA